MNTKRLIYETRDLMVKAGVKDRDIDQFLAEVRLSNSVRKLSLCREWQAKLGVRSQKQQQKTPELTPEAESNVCEAEVAAACLECPAERFLECVLA